MELTEINQNTQARDLNARLHRYNTQLCCTRSVSLWRMSYWRIFLSGFIYFRYYYCKARGVESVNLTIKIKLSLCFLFNRAPRHEGLLEEWRHSSTHSLTWALDGGEWSASRPGRFIPRERAPVTHWIRGWVAPEPFWTRRWTEKFPAPAEKTYWGLEVQPHAFFTSE
jgi:hypothetical protein